MKFALLAILLLGYSSCRKESAPSAPATQIIASDEQLFSLVTGQQALTRYVLFPHADSVVSGTLNGSNAHRPLVRVVLNPTAVGALPGGRGASGLSFPDGSVILKEVRMDSVVSLYAVLYKERDNPLSSGGWLWAEFKPDGKVVYSIKEGGSGCVSCHAREQGTQHDHVRTFERQSP